MEHDPDSKIEYCYIAMEILCEAVSKSNHKDFLNKVQEMFDKLSGPVILIRGQNKAENGSKEKERFPLSLKHLTNGLKGEKRSNENNITNIFCLYPPKRLKKVIGWAKNHYLSSSLLLYIEGDRIKPVSIHKRGSIVFAS